MVASSEVSGAGEAGERFIAPDADPALWRESALRPLRAVGRRERARLRAIALRLEWVRLEPGRRQMAENLVWWAEEHLDLPSQRLWLVELWTLNRARGLRQCAEQKPDLRRAFAQDLRCMARRLHEAGDAPAEGRAECEFLRLWSDLREQRDSIPRLAGVLDQLLHARPNSFRQVVEQLERLDQQAEAVWRHQFAPRRLLHSVRSGGEIGWFLDPAESCPVEASRMHHCGNGAAPKAGDRLVSLRRRERRHGVWCWWPLLTGVLDAQGRLVEMKGPGNTRPSAAHHRDLVWLMAHPVVREVRLQTRALPCEDLRFGDLPRRLINWLRDERPTLLVRWADGVVRPIADVYRAPEPPLRSRVDWMGWLEMLGGFLAPWALLLLGALFFSLIQIVAEGWVLILRE